MTLYLEAFFDLVQELFPAQEDELPPAKMPKFAVQADDATALGYNLDTLWQDSESKLR